MKRRVDPKSAQRRCGARRGGNSLTPIRAFTLIELLVVIAIVVVLSALLIPQIRVISKDRTLRESSRAVSSVFVDAIERARVDGAAGVALVRNPRFYRYVDNVGTAADANGSRVFYACYTLYQMKRLPPYVGNFQGDVAVFLNPVSGATQFDVVLPEPFDSNVEIQAGTYLQLGDSPNKYLIDNVVELAAPPFPGYPQNLIQVTFSIRPFQSGPPANHGDAFSFKVHRRLRIVPSSEVSLPRGYIVNLNYSGDLDTSNGDLNDFTWTSFTQNLAVINGPPVVEPNLEPVMILFDADGSVDRILPNGYLGVSVYPSAGINLCLSEDEFDHTYALSTTPLRRMPQSYYKNTSAPTDVLNDPSVMWVSVDHRSGYVGVGTSAPPANTPFMAAEASGLVGATQVARLLEALRITATRKEAAQ